MPGVLVNGSAAQGVGYRDRGLQYGDGLFETIGCQEGRPRWLALHLDRLRRGLARLKLPFREFAALQVEIGALAADQARCVVKVIITRGEASRRGYAPIGDERPTRIISCHEWPRDAAEGAPFRIGISSVRLGINPLLAGLKHLNRLEQVLAQQEMTGSDLNEVLMLSATGQVISGSMSNVFFVDEQGIITPRLHECGVEGVMRRVVLETAAAAGMEVRECDVSVAQLVHVHEAFITNVRLGVKSVGWLEGCSLSDDRYAQLIRRHIDATQP